ncbi:sulfite exporter TauE/SafE family protein [Acidovorax sp. GBBC 3334]|uniref:sulfite exporter TauE/SafE family protein n=1 Tax=Acidovorax sp. GBBC 3334 TaxID=2940496 RepID=UPI003FA4668E
MAAAGGWGTWAAGVPWAMACAAALVFLLAGMVKGVVGLGLPTVSMALLALWMPPAQAAALLVVPSLATNLWQMRPWRGAPALLWRHAGLQAGICAGTWAGAWWLGAPQGQGARMALGAALIAYAGWSLAGAHLPPVPARHQRWLGFPVGAVTGGITAATGVFVVPAVPYLQALGLQRDALVQAMGLCFTVSTIALGAGLASQASLPPATLAVSVLLLAPAVAGMALGARLRRHLSPDAFRRCLMAGLLVLGLGMLLG